MRDTHFRFGRADNCIPDDQCPSASPQCDCKPNETCALVPRTCHSCSHIQCTPKPNSGGGVNPGVIAGPIIGVALVLASLALFWWLRRKKRRDLARLEELAERARKGESSAFHLSTPGSPSGGRSNTASQMLNRSPASGGNQLQLQQARAVLPNVPADAEYYDENGTTIRVYTGKRGAINADPNHPDNGGNGDPFADSRSMSTAGSGHSTNVIPIHYVPGGQSDDTLTKALHGYRDGEGTGVPPTADQQAAAARTLDQARQNLFRPRNGAPPPRPARAPDLDLRLNPAENQGQMTELSNGSRTSMVSFNSASPSFMSTNTSDVNLDIPKIVTRQQIQVGRLQAAQAVNVANLRSPNSPPSQSSATAPNPFGSDGAESAARPSLESQRFADDGNFLSQPSPTDLRFSMGSLAFDRASISTQGTGGHRPPVPPIERHRFESMSSSHSVGGESLGNFPMMITPPSANGSGSPRSLPGVPQNSSTITLDLGNSVTRPPQSYKHTGDGRPMTTASSHSIADSFLGNFPFLPPNVPALPTDSPLSGTSPTTSASPLSANASRLTLGMSGISEGLGGFDFSFDDEEGKAADPPTPRAPTVSKPW